MWPISSHQGACCFDGKNSSILSVKSDAICVVGSEWSFQRLMCIDPSKKVADVSNDDQQSCEYSSGLQFSDV